MSAETVHVWLVDLNLPAATLAELKELLDLEERRRLAGLGHAAGRRRFTAAHGAMRVILGDWLGVPPEKLRWRHGPAGKPELAGAWAAAQVNLSHSREVAVLAVTDRRPVGVDIQHMSHRLDAARFAVRYFTEAESRYVAAGGATQQAERLFQVWARKEACVKAAGGRLALGLRLPVVAPEAADPGTEVVVRDPAGVLPGDYLVRDLVAPPGFRGAVAVVGSRPYRVVRHRWPERQA